MKHAPHRILAASSGTVWVGTLSRLYRLSRGPEGRYRAERFTLGPTSPITKPVRNRIQTLAEDPGGAVWVGTHLDGFFRIGPDGRVDHCPDDVLGASFVRDFYFPGDGSVWTAYFGGVAIFGPELFEKAPCRAQRTFSTREGMSLDTAEILPARDGRLLVASTQGITEMRRTSSGEWTVGTTLDRRSGLPGDWVISMARDAEGSIWAGLGSRGLVKLLESGFSILDEEEGAGTGIIDLAVDRSGRIVTVASRGAQSLNVTLHAGGSRTYRPRLPASATYVGWGGNQKLLIDSRGAWWIATGAGVLRWDDPGDGDPYGVERPADAVIGVAEGLPGNDAYVLFEDSRGDVWISSQPVLPGLSALSRWSRSTGTVETYPLCTVGTNELPFQFLQTRDGTLWILFLGGRLSRYLDGRLEPVPGWPPDEGTVTSLFEEPCIARE